MDLGHPVEFQIPRYLCNFIQNLPKIQTANNSNQFCLVKWMTTDILDNDTNIPDNDPNIPDNNTNILDNGHKYSG